MADILKFPDDKRPPKPKQRTSRKRDNEREIELEHEVLELRLVIADLACELMRERAAHGAV